MYKNISVELIQAGVTQANIQGGTIKDDSCLLVQAA